MKSSQRLLRRLNEASAPYVDPLERLRWDEIATDAWWLPPEALSLAGVPAFEALPLEVRRRLSHLEFAWVLETGAWLESLFIERFGRAAGEERADPALRMRYLHEVREEAGHSLMFLELLRRSGVQLPGGAQPRSPLAAAAGRLLPFSGALFWTLTVIGEELGDALTRTVPRAVEHATVSAVVYHMARLHVRDEARHVAHTRSACEEAVARMAPWRRRLLSPLVDAAIDAFARRLYFPPAAIYEAAGLPPGTDWRALALRSAPRRRFAARSTRSTREFLGAAGWRLRVPAA
jgi:hypothetical protein